MLGSHPKRVSVRGIVNSDYPEPATGVRTGTETDGTTSGSRLSDGHSNLHRVSSPQTDLFATPQLDTVMLDDAL